MRSLDGLAYSTFSPVGLRRGLPLRPRFLDELVVIPVEDGVVIDGGKQLHILDGASARVLLRKLLPLMDGTRTIGQIQEQLPEVRAASLHAAISQLSNWALIEDGAADDVTDIVLNQETLAFFRRHAAAGIYRSGREACQKLKEVKIVVLDSGQDVAEIESLQSALVLAGVERVMVLQENALSGHADLDPARSLVVSLGFHGEDFDKHIRLDEQCYAHNLSWLRAVFNQEKGFADLGPLFNPVKACYRCFHAMHCAPRPSVSRIAEHCMANAQMFVSLIALEIIYLLSNLGPSLTWRGLQRYELPEWSPRNLRCARIPGCARCRPCAAQSHHALSAPQSVLIDTAVVFEDYIGLPSRPPSVPGIEPGFSAINSEPTRQTTRLANCPQVFLDRSVPQLHERLQDALDVKAVTTPEVLTLDRLATILNLTAGIRDDEVDPPQIQRWAATAGNLGSVELFVIAFHVLALAPGIYFYQPGDHSLALLKPRNELLGLREFMFRIALHAGGNAPDVLILFSGAFHRVAQKYAQFGYRLIHFDAGVALSQLHLAARALNIASRTVTRWPDDLIEEQLNLTPVQQQVTAVAALLGRNYTLAKADLDFQPPPLVAEKPSSTKCVREFSEFSSEQLFDRLMHESRLREGDVCAAAFEVPAQLVNTPGKISPVLPLPPPARLERFVSEVLGERASVRYYKAEAVSGIQVSSMLYNAHQGDSADWPWENAHAQTLTFLVLASRVQGFSPGVYTYLHRDRALAPARGALAPEEMTDLFVQPEFASAPVIIWIAGDLAAACGRHGAFGHRQLLLRAGAAVNRLWMTALATGLKGCIVAGAVPGAARQHLGLDGYRQASLIAFAAGH